VVWRSLHEAEILASVALAVSCSRSAWAWAFALASLADRSRSAFACVRAAAACSSAVFARSESFDILSATVVWSATVMVSSNRGISA
jgi:hypothetical protein